MSTTKPAFSVCVIVRNMANTLPRLGASLKEFLERGGDFLVMDTGSTDGSPDVARSLGARVVEVGERFMHDIDAETADQINARFVADGDEPITAAGSRLFHFADARNYCASLAENDWVSWADGDEAFTALNLDAIDAIIANPNLEHCEYDFVFAHGPDGVSPAVALTQSKMYRRDRIRWEGAVHEIIHRYTAEPVTGTNKVFLPPAIFHLEHWQEQRDHRSNYLPGLAWDAWMKERQDPAGNLDRQMHYLGREMMYFKRYRSAILTLSEHVAMQKWPAERAQSLIYMGDCYGELGDAEQQIHCYHQAFHADSSRRIGLLRLAEFYRKARNWQACAAFADAALTVSYTPFYANFMPEYAEIPHVLLYQAAGWMGKLDAARFHLKTALAYAPWQPEAVRDAKFYWGYDLEKAPEGWMYPLEMLWLIDAAQGKARICEVGSWKGRSTHALCWSAQKTGGQVWAVDHWMGSVGEDAPHAEAKRDPDAVYRQFLDNTREFLNLHPVRVASQEAARLFDDESFDMVFVDASHTKEEVAADLRAWGPKVKFGGILCGHDFSPGWPGVQAAVREFLGREPDEVVGTIWVAKR